MFTLPDVDGIVAAALAEDLGVPASFLEPGAPMRADILERDVTSFASVPQASHLAGRIVARESLVVAGLPVADAVFATLARVAGMDESVEIFPCVAEGTLVEAGAAVAEIEGDARLVLAAERTALDFLMVLSGIASEARRWQEAAGDRVTVVDTRKTYPGLRTLSKYATLVGGARNHRQGLWDMVLVKDNHLRRTSIVDAVAAARELQPGLPVEVEADTIGQAIEAARAGADIVLLDNMDDDTLAEAVEAVHAAASEAGVQVLTEASGGITIDRAYAMRRIGVDRVSTSALTFARPRDLALDAEWTA